MAKKLMQFLTVAQLSERTGWKEATIRQKCWRKELPYYKLGKSVRFAEADIARMIEESFVPALEAR